MPTAECNFESDKKAELFEFKVNKYNCQMQIEKKCVFI